MSKLNGRQLSYAVAHGTIKVPNAAQIGPTLSDTLSPNGKAVKMTIQDNLVVIELPSNVPGKPEHIYVPLTNFSHFTVKAESSAKDSKA